jgi:VIT1/CCC1 family predicted Fe2+/Mn2+ transporter
MNPPPARTRILNPIERFSEIVFGLIMVLSFTCAISVVEAGREDVRTMLIGAICCNIAWGIIDAVFYLLACIAEQSRNAMLLRHVQQTADPAQTRQTIAGALPPKIADALQAADFDRIDAHLKDLPPPAAHSGITRENWLGALGVFLLIVFATFPVVVPFMFIHNARPALLLSNAVAIVMLFCAGNMLAGYAGLRRLVTGLVMVAIGAVLAALTIALGG